jgi:hypothetical protein
MTSTEAVLFATLGPLALGLRVPPAIEGPLHDELEPFISLRGGSPPAEPRLELELRLAPGPSAWRAATEGRRVPVDTSLYRHLASEGLRFPIPGGYVVRIELTRSHVFFDGAGQRVVLYQPDAGLLVRDAVRTIKSLLTPLIETLGGVQIDSAGVTLEDGRGVLVLGDMWQGKTTLLLELLAEFRGRQLTCDRWCCCRRPAAASAFTGGPRPSASRTAP